MDITPYAIPAFLALAVKAVIFFYARFSGLRNLETRLYLLFLFALAVQNLAEISVFTSKAQGLSSPSGGLLYFAGSILALALFLHFTLVLAQEERARSLRDSLVALIYLPAAGLELLLWSGNWLVAGFVPLGYTYTKIPGPLYFLFEFYAVGYVCLGAAILLYGSRQQDTPIKRLKNKITFLSLLPMFVVVVAVISLQHYSNLRAFNTTVTLPIAITFFLAVSAYATHQYRVFDIEFYIPWSKVRKRKTAFYGCIRAMIAEIADLGSVREAVHRLADTLRCPVALVSTGKPVLAVAGGAPQMVAFPLEQLRQIDHIVVANEIADTAPETYNLMRNHGVAAVVPFYPHSQNASGWMLLGDAFSEQVYSSLDFKMVEQLFDKMAELFLDKLLLMRGQLAAAERRLQTMEFRLQEAETGIATLRNENETLQQLNLRLAREQAADSLLVTRTPGQTTLPSIVLLGRDKALLKRLRRHFPQADQYVGPDSASFRRQDLPEVLICRLETAGNTDEAWLSLLADKRQSVAILLYGDGARSFIAAHLDALSGVLVEILPEDATDDALVRRLQALASLRRATRAIFDPACPLVGMSQPFHETMRDATRLAGFAEPVLIESHDPRETAAMACYLHETAGRSGNFRTLPATAATRPEPLAEALAACQGGTLLLTGVDTLASENREKLLAVVLAAGNVRLISGVDSADDALRTRFRSFVLRLPTLRERRLDLPMLVHYFTLQYNLRAGTRSYLTQAEVDDLMAVQYPENMDALRTAVFDRLNTKHRDTIPAPEMEFALTDQTLEERVAVFEARLIEQTLRHCQGNKSKAARLLGLRPNTLHYKLERYGLTSGKNRSDN